MFEVLYVCGLWVSELVGLILEQVNLCQGVVKVFGKGSKECLVLFGEEVIGWFECYLCEVCGDLFGGWFSDVLFFSLCGEQMICQIFWYCIKYYVQVVVIGMLILLYILCYVFVIYLFNYGVDLWVVQMLFGYSDLLIIQIYIYIVWVCFQDLYVCYYL